MAKKVNRGEQNIMSSVVYLSKENVNTVGELKRMNRMDIESLPLSDAILAEVKTFLKEWMNMFDLIRMTNLITKINLYTVYINIYFLKEYKIKSVRNFQTLFIFVFRTLYIYL